MADRTGLIALAVSTWFFGFSFGLYEILLPLYMDSLSISLMDIGYVFTISALFIAFLSLILGAKSDIYGRKIFMTSALLLGGFSHLLTPLFSSVIMIAIVKIMFDSAVAVRGAVFTPMVYEQDRQSFISSYSRISGLEFISQAIGLISAGLLVSIFDYRAAFTISSTLQIIGFLILALFFKENRKIREKDVLKINGKGNVEKKFSRELKILSISGIVLLTGSSATHLFTMTLFFSKKFLLSPEVLSILMTLHRLSLGVPMLYSDRIIKGSKRVSYKSFLMLFTTMQGLFTALATVPESFLASAFIWLLHDPFGASVWFTLRNFLIQKYSKDETRGRDFNIVSFISSMGSVIGPFMAGCFGSININLPFLIGGLIMILSNLLIIPL
jgi:DHA1 family multidrug resistance protein-like MFS transporter